MMAVKRKRMAPGPMAAARFSARKSAKARPKVKARAIVVQQLTKAQPREIHHIGPLMWRKALETMIRIRVSREKGRT